MHAEYGLTACDSAHLVTLATTDSYSMPPEVGQVPFWSAMVNYVAHGPDNLDTLPAEPDAA